MKRIILVSMAVMSLVMGCSRTYGITERAKKQLPVSLKEYINEFVPAIGDIDIRNLKTVYENDSICLLQFTAACKDTSGQDRQVDLRYVYLYDDVVSVMNGKMTFNEVFHEIPCMPDDLIKKNRETVRRNKESVFMNLYGSTLPVLTPFDR